MSMGQFMKAFLSGIVNCELLDPSSWVRRQLKRHSHFGSLIEDYFRDDGFSVFGSDLDKSSSKWKMLNSQT